MMEILKKFATIIIVLSSSIIVAYKKSFSNVYLKKSIIMA